MTKRQDDKLFRLVGRLGIDMPRMPAAHRKHVLDYLSARYCRRCGKDLPHAVLPCGGRRG